MGREETRQLRLLATIFISDAGFARWLAGPITKVTGKGVLPFFVQNYFAEVILVGALIAFDLITRRKLHPAVAAAIVFGFANEVVASIVYNLPAWTPIATRIIGR